MPGSIAFQAQSASHQATTAFHNIHNIDLRIRVLTTILSILDPQAASPTKGPSSIEFKVAMHIATLLTRGADERKGKMGPNIRPIAVATRTTVDSVNILATIDRDDSDPDAPESGFSNDFVVTQNPTSDDRVAFGVTEIESKDLDDVQRDELLSSDHSPEDITLSQHAADVLSLFNNIRTARRGGSEQALAVREFIVRRCAPIISHRLRSDKFIFQDTTLDQILQGWRPSDGDHFVKTECEIPKRLIRLFQTVGIQCRQSNGKCFAPWAKDIAPAWMEAFLSCLSLCKDYFKLEGKKVASNTTRGAIALKLLQTLVESEGFKYLLGLRSVNAILVLNRRQARSNTENTEDPSARSDTESAEDPASSDAGNTEGSARSNTENPEDSDDTHGDNLELTAETEEDAVALTTRYLGDAVAWITATDFLSGPRIRRTPRLRLHLAITAPPVEPKAMGDAVPIFTDIFNKTLKDWEDQSRGRNSRVRTWYWQSVGKLRKCKEFHGTIHCEASLMGAIVQYSGQANNTQNTQLPEIFHSTSNKPRTIGVAKKCCWCCSMLATLLNSTDIQFSLPGSHGRIFPWALPSMGISYEVACSLEEKLKNQLSLAIWKMLDELKHMSESQTSSPVSDGSSDELELELGSDRWNGGMDGLEHDLRLRNRILFPVS